MVFFVGNKFTIINYLILSLPLLDPGQILSVSALVHCYIDAVTNVKDQCKLPQKRSGAFYIFAFYS